MRARLRKKRSRALFINTYEVDMAFGGHEEGGWWYRYGTPVETRKMKRHFGKRFERVLKDATAAAKEANVGRHPISSVLSDGEAVVFIEEHAGMVWPGQQPRYS